MRQIDDFVYFCFVVLGLGLHIIAVGLVIFYTFDVPDEGYYINAS